MAKPVHRGCTLGVKFRPGFDMKLLCGQNGGHPYGADPELLRKVALRQWVFEDWDDAWWDKMASRHGQETLARLAGARG